MNPLHLGSTLLHKYRIDRLRKRKDGVVFYDAVDTFHPRRVCIRVLERAASTDAVKCARFHDEAHAANVVDIGTCDGLPYFVTSELGPPQPRPSKAPPPLPKRSSSKPPPLPKPKAPALPPPEIPIFVDDDAILLSAPPPPPPPISSESILPIPTAFEMRPRERSRAPWTFLFVAVVAIAGLGGWYFGHAQADITPLAAPDEPPMPTQASPPTVTTPEPSAAPVETVTKPEASESAAAPEPPAPSSKPRPRPTTDPLTLYSDRTRAGRGRGRRAG